MVAIAMMQQQQASSAPASHPNTPLPPSSSSLGRSPGALSLAPFSSVHRISVSDHVVAPPPTISPMQSPAEPLVSVARVRFADIAPYDGAPAGPYLRAVEALSGSLTRHNAAVIEVGAEDAVLMRCGLEAARLYLRTRVQPQTAGNANGKGASRGVFMYRAGRAIEEWDSSPPCMAEIFRSMGKVARAALFAISRYLRLRSDAFIHLLDDTPLPTNEVSSSVLVASHHPTSLPNGKGPTGGGKLGSNGEVERGLLTLISSDIPGLQVCDPNGRWYMADSGSSPGDLLLITGKALSHTTAGLRPAALYRTSPDSSVGSGGIGRTSLAFRLMPQGNAILDCRPILAAGHIIPQSYVPVSVSQFMDDLSAEEDTFSHGLDTTCDFHHLPFARQPCLSDFQFTMLSYSPKRKMNNDDCEKLEEAAGNDPCKGQTLRSVLSDPLSGAYLEDAMVVSCGHSFGGLALKRVLEMARCTLCNSEIETGSLIPNHALRAAAAAVKHEDDRRLFHNAALRKRRRELAHPTDPLRRLNRENGDDCCESGGLQRVVQYPFSVNEKVLIKGNKRTPERFFGKEAVITSQCLNGWYLLKIVETGESIRLQYRSLGKMRNLEEVEERCPPSQSIQNGE